MDTFSMSDNVILYFEGASLFIYFLSFSDVDSMGNFVRYFFVVELCKIL